MGLDLYLYKVEKPNIELANSIIHIDDFLKQGYISLVDNAINSENETITSLTIPLFVRYTASADKEFEIASLYEMADEEDWDVLFDEERYIFYVDEPVLAAKKIGSPNSFGIFSEAEIAYQRKGLNSYKHLPENGCFSVDKEIVSKLVEDGLSPRFLEVWVDGETVFHYSR